jgi:ATP-dependent protease Clp ATPase subunit
MAGNRENFFCSFCGVDRYHTRKLVTGLGAVVCEGCVSLCRSAEKHAPEATLIIPIQPLKVGPVAAPPWTKSSIAPFAEACPFCGLTPSKERKLFVAEVASICSECTVLCEGIYEEERRGRPS